MQPEGLVGWVLNAWALVAHRFEPYSLITPVSPSFVCKAADCQVHCCRIFSVSLDDREAARMTREHGLQMVQFVESENGEPISLPLARPYLLARTDGGCALLQPGTHFCGAYEGRPDACRQYPHHTVFVEPATGQLVHGDTARMTAAYVALVAGEVPELVPLLLGHNACPGFDGPPIGEKAWRELLLETIALQFPEVAGIA